MDGSGGSGGSGGNTNANPYVVVSGGSWGVGGTGSATATTPVSIGAALVVMVTPATGETSKTITVGGMSTISSYFSTAPNATAPENMTLGQTVNVNPTPNPNTGIASTSFIVDANPRQYTINVQVTYTSGDSGTTKIMFTSQAPTGTLTVLSQGQANLTAGRTGLTDTNPNGPRYFGGIDIDATTSPISYQSGGNTVYITGNFMIMQTVNASNSYTAGGTTYVMNSTTSNPSIDNGVSGDPAQIGHEVVPPPNQNYGAFGWTLPYTQGDPPVTVTTATYGFSDSPSISVTPGINNLSSLTVGSTGGNPPVPGGNPETFTTYLMYQPTGGVWVGLSSVNWGWGGNATSSNGTTLDPASLSLSDSGTASVTQPLTGTAAFPTWTGSTQTIFRNGWQQQN